jgi:hypothetical protein
MEPWRGFIERIASWGYPRNSETCKSLVSTEPVYDDLGQSNYDNEFYRDKPTMTIGIGVLCENADCVVLVSDTRMSYDPVPIRPHDRSGKQWDLPKPFRGAATTAGKMWCVQPYVDELYASLTLLGEQKKRIEVEQIENAINDSRDAIHYRYCDWQMRRTYKLSISQWQCGEIPGGKLHPLIVTAGEELIARTEFPASLIVAGFIDDRLIWTTANQANPLRTNVSPGIFVIGSNPLPIMNHLVARKQSAERRLSSSLLHVCEALELARRNRYVGKAADYMIFWRNRPTVERFPAKSDLLKGWAKTYRKRTSTVSLDSSPVATTQIERLLLKHNPRQ